MQSSDCIQLLDSFLSADSVHSRPSFYMLAGLQLLHYSNKY